MIKCDVCNKVRADNQLAEVDVEGVLFTVCNRCSREIYGSWIINPNSNEVSITAVHYFEIELWGMLENG